MTSSLKPAPTDEQLSATLGPQADDADVIPFAAIHDVQIVYGSACGSNGRNIGIKNNNRGQRIRVYYRAISNMTSPTQSNRVIGPGQTAWICCSSPGGGQWWQVEIQGAEYV